MTKTGEPTKGDKRRTALVQAAAELFWQRGYAATSLAQIADQADVPLGNVYYYFKSKTALAMAVADLFVGQTEDLVEEVKQSENEPRPRLRLLIGRLRSTQKSRIAHGCPIAAACREFVEEDGKSRERAAQSFLILTGFIASELVRSGQRPALAMARARALVCEWQGGIALAHALGEGQILAETFARMERTATQ